MEMLLNGRWTLNLPDHRATQWADDWEPARLNDMHDRIKSGMTIVDVGAEEGDMSALFAQWAGPSGRMILVEPFAAVWPNIKWIWENNDGLAPVHRWFVGFAGRTRTEWLDMDTVSPFPVGPYYCDDMSLQEWPVVADGVVIDDHGFAHLYQETDVIPALPLDSLVPSCDVITMDVEGAELEVLYGATRLLDQHRPIVWVSIHPDFMRDMYNQHPDELYALMGSHGYEATELGYDHEQHVRFDPV